jgi:phosphopantothenoylcysteine decarboxylase/phosphopantothenate--cysteine ligase
MKGRRVLLGITGGIAAYKSAELARRLVERGVDVQVVMTASARQFITPLTLQAVSGMPVRSELLDPAAEAGMSHIELARWPELILIAPASANFLARLAHGLADDLLSTLCLASDRPLLLAPAMNRLMWSKAVTQGNAELLRQRGMVLLGPDSGAQACGETGPGRMREPLALVDAVADALNPQAQGPLAGKRLLVTAGPTREPIDPVRFVSNRSSGRMGFCVAEAGVLAGAEVVLVAGPVALATPLGVERIDVETAAEMHSEVLSRAATADIFVATAAVSDYRVDHPCEQKIKKSEPSLELALVRNPDILAEVARLENGPYTVGFAAETERVEEHAQEKLRRKGLDLIAANEVGGGQGFDREDNELRVLWEGGREHLERASKRELAARLIELIVERFVANDRAEDSGFPNRA